MCIGVPMQVLSCEGHSALCLHQGVREEVDLSLVGEQPPGTWVLVFLGAAREVMDEASARQTQDAVTALQHIMAGEPDVDHLFADLVEREPYLPEHLRDVVGDTYSKKSGDTTS